MNNGGGYERMRASFSRRVKGEGRRVAAGYTRRRCLVTETGGCVCVCETVCVCVCDTVCV